MNHNPKNPWVYKYTLKSVGRAALPRERPSNKVKGMTELEKHCFATTNVITDSAKIAHRCWNHWVKSCWEKRYSRFSKCHLTDYLFITWGEWGSFKWVYLTDTTFNKWSKSAPLINRTNLYYCVSQKVPLVFK